MQEEPCGYQEIGESIGQAVAEGLMTPAKAVELARLLDYGPSDVKAWADYYRSLNVEYLAKLSRDCQRRDRKIRRWQARSRALKGQRSEGA